jgi:hypothetical protein
MKAHDFNDKEISLIPGRIYYLEQVDMSRINIPENERRLFVFRGMSRRKLRRYGRDGTYQEKGRSRMVCEMELLADNNSCPSSVSLKGMAKIKLLRAAVKLIDVKELPAYVWLHNKYPGFDRLLNGEDDAYQKS